MLGLIINETQAVNKFKESNTMDCSTYSMIGLLIKKYYLDGIDKEIMYKNIMDDLNNYMGKEFIYTNWDSNMSKWIKRFYKNLSIYDTNVKMIDIEVITITKKELEHISNLNNLILEKLAFILLVYAKITNLQFQNDKSWVNKSYSVICKEAHVDLRGVEQRRIFHELVKQKYINASNNNSKTSIKVEFVDNDKMSENGIIINDFEGVIYQYLIWKGQKWVKCEKCGKWIIPRNNKTKYCGVCAKEMQLEWQRESMKKSRSSKICEVIENI